jgi:hemerythrin-like domain-containing protein
MSEDIRKLQDEHENFGKLLDLLGSQLQRFHQGQRPNYELMQDIMYYMTHYSDHFHHPKEDLVFTKLLEHEASIQPVVEDLLAQHRAVMELGVKLYGEFSAIVSEAILARTMVTEPCQGYIDGMRRHMSLEEERLFPLAATLLLEEDWAEINAVMTAGMAPLSGRVVEERSQTLLKEITEIAAYENT